MARRCIIHIGHPKTATTFLQHCMHLNAARFAEAGFWVPSDFTPFGSYNLEVLSRQGNIVSGNLAPMHVLETEGPGDLRPAMEQYLFAAPQMPPGCDILLSSELYFYYWPCTVRLAQRAAEYGFTPEFMAYLPRQDHAAISAYLQNVRFHGFSHGVVDFLVHDTNIAYCDYGRVLTRLRTALPGVPITLRSFEPQFFTGGGVLADFLATIDCALRANDCTRPAQTSNQGLRLEQYELLRAANVLRREDVATRLRDAETTLSADDRARTFAWYYRPGVQDFVRQRFWSANKAMLDQFMPDAGAAERSYWLRFADAPALPEMQSELFATLRAEAFAGR